ncbi:uncharacterized protein LOC108827207 isoform X2 [Raphanus sativus]|uniref:Uncharacterized protein LOC108827207 isoform X2 n=1 Tax=Raphanus sativus TaxID=3726 RepID=A0A6J0L772_RAPSA|nr:uncharacterized protein LOC108827207 isoform X2 [Raphanus sativus]
MDASHTSDAYISISNDVISKSRNDLVFSGELDESVLSELHATWRRKMIQAGVIRGTIETTPLIQDPNPLHGYDKNQSGIDKTDDQFPSTELAMSIKNEGDYIPQHDGAFDDIKPSAFASHDDDDESLNEDDDYEEDEINDDEDIPHLIMCQFDYVKKRKNKWECKLKAGVMQINEKNILFSETKGDFTF